MMSDDHVLRCRWTGRDPLMCAYHDEEWGRPIHDSRMLWETLMLEGFQAGLSWRTVLHRREGFRRAFAGFDPEIVAGFDAGDVERLMADSGIIRARAKIDATLTGARIWLAMRDAGEDFGTFVWGLVPDAPIVNDTGEVQAQSPASQMMSKELKKRGFKFVGPVIVQAWMQAVGMIDDHDPDCFLHYSRRSDRQS